MNPNLLGQLHDIHDIDPVGWWPPAIGWWLVGLAALLLLAALPTMARALLRWWRRPRGAWRQAARRELHALRRGVDQEEPKQLIGRLSELLRRIALARCGRHPIAGLAGDAWLRWLSRNDPNGFDWSRRGRALVELAYAPPGTELNRAELHQLIDAALAWTRADEVCEVATDV